MKALIFMGLGVVVGFTAVNSLTRPPAEAPMMDDTVPAAQSTVKPNKPGVSPQRADKVVLTDAEWKKRLTPEQYRILRNHGTEAAFCGLFVDNKKTGTYSCVGCKLPLFRSDAKFDSGTGWPSFFQPATADAIWTRTDTSYGMVREEVLCARCDGHLGHVFPDGPRDRGGMRFCINSEILTFQEAK